MTYVNMKKCFFCLSIRTATLILLYLNLFWAVSAIFSSEVITVRYGNISSTYISENGTTAAASVFLVASLCGLYGVYKEQRTFLLGYLVLHTLMAISSTIGIIFLTFVDFKMIYKNSYYALIYLILLWAEALYVYFGIIAFAHYQSLSKHKPSSTQNNQPLEKA